MKILAASLLLLFQLQPVLGSAVCLLSSDRPSNEECEMPDQHIAQGSLLESGAPTQGCALASACAASALAVPGLAEGQESIIPLHSAAATPAAATLNGIASAPPFHPPRP